MTLRLAEPKDADVVLELLKKTIVHANYGFLFGSEDTLKIAVDQFLNPDNKDLVCIVKEQAEKIIGFAAFEKIPCLYSTHFMARLAAWYIEEEFRGQGFKKEVLGALEYWGNLRDCKFVNIGVSKKDVSLEDFGYVKYEELWMKEIK
jgi:RimJ/RimL family protein N-acetyltransferase